MHVLIGAGKVIFHFELANHILAPDIQAQNETRSFRLVLYIFRCNDNNPFSHCPACISGQPTRPRTLQYYAAVSLIVKPPIIWLTRFDAPDVNKRLTHR
jgi:hypothetical protein